MKNKVIIPVAKGSVGDKRFHITPLRRLPAGKGVSDIQKEEDAVSEKHDINLEEFKIFEEEVKARFCRFLLNQQL